MDTDMRNLLIEGIEELARDGWCVMLKRLPPGVPFLAEGSRSEYDAPSEDKAIGRDKWGVELDDFAWHNKPGARYRNSCFGFGDTPLEALNRAKEKIR